MQSERDIELEEMKRRKYVKQMKDNIREAIYIHEQTYHSEQFKCAKCGTTIKRDDYSYKDANLYLALRKRMICEECTKEKYGQCECQTCGDEVPYTWEYCSEQCQKVGEAKKEKEKNENTKNS